MACNAEAYIKFTQCGRQHIIQKADENRTHKREGEFRVRVQTVEYSYIFDNIFHYRYDSVAVFIMRGGNCNFTSFVCCSVFDFLV